MELPPAAWHGMAGWARPLDHPMRRDDCADRCPGQGYRHGCPDGGRNLFDKATEDALSSWFGDDVAQQRRDEGQRGRGPRNYTRSVTRIEEVVHVRQMGIMREGRQAMAGLS